MKRIKLYEDFKGISDKIQREYDRLILQSMDGGANDDIWEIEDRIDEIREMFPDIRTSWNKTNEGQHGSITIYGKNENEPKQKLGYAGSVEVAEDIEKDFEEDFDDVWHEDEDEYLKNF